jgi:hypothetical protein
MTDRQTRSFHDEMTGIITGSDAVTIYTDAADDSPQSFYERITAGLRKLLYSADEARLRPATPAPPIIKENDINRTAMEIQNECTDIQTMAGGNSAITPCENGSTGTNEYCEHANCYQLNCDGSCVRHCCQ